MKYKGKDYDDNQMLELLNSMEQQISDGVSKLQGAEEKIKSYETQITDLNNDISNLKIKNYDLLTSISVAPTTSTQSEEQKPKLISIDDLLK